MKPTCIGKKRHFCKKRHKVQFLITSLLIGVQTQNKVLVNHKNQPNMKINVKVL